MWLKVTCLLALAAFVACLVPLRSFSLTVGAGIEELHLRERCSSRFPAAGATDEPYMPTRLTFFGEYECDFGSVALPFQDSWYSRTVLGVWTTGAVALLTAGTYVLRPAGLRWR